MSLGVKFVKPAPGSDRGAGYEINFELSPREIQILRMRLGIGMKTHTLPQIGEALGILSMRVSELESHAVIKLAHRFPNKCALSQEDVARVIGG